MNDVRSDDGTLIAYDRVGEGPPLIVVGGAFSYRRWKGLLQLTELVAKRFAVINYDRRGREDSGDTAPYAVEREIEDLAALVEANGDSAYVWGMSSGGVLALRAAAAGVPITKLAVYQPPFLVDRDGFLPPSDFATRLDELIAADRRGDAVTYFMSEGMGVPRALVSLMRLARPLWSRLKAVAHTLPYDLAVMGDTVSGEPLAPQPWTSVATPTAVMVGGKSPARLRAAADALAELLPDAERLVLDGQSHNVSMRVLAPALEELFTPDVQDWRRAVPA